MTLKFLVNFNFSQQFVQIVLCLEKNISAVDGDNYIDPYQVIIQ